MNAEPHPSFSFSRKFSQRLNVLVGILSLLAIVVMVNYLAVRRYERFHLRLDDQAKLSPMSLRLLDTLTNEIKVIAYFSREETLYADVRELLREYKSASPRLTLEWVDPLRDPGSAELIKAKYSLPAVDQAFVLFESMGRVKVVRQADLFEYDMQPLVSGQSKEVKRKDFRGEMLFSSAIYSVSSQRTLKAYFVTGVGEASPREQSEEGGFSRLASMIQTMGIEWDTLDLRRVQQVPPDCNLLVVLGPRFKAPPASLEAFQKYLESGGRAFILFDVFGAQQDTGFEEALRKFGVKVGFDTVKDPQSMSLAGGQDMQVSTFTDHPITKTLKASESAGVHLILPRSIQPLPRSAGAMELSKVDTLFYTSPMGTLYEPLATRGSTANSARISDIPTNQPLAVAVERGGLPGVAAAQGGTSRIVVVGDSMFLNNRMISSAGNSVFASYALNWLVDRSVLLSGIGPSPYREFRLAMTRRERLILNWVFLGGMPGAVLVMGFLVWLRRRS